MRSPSSRARRALAGIFVVTLVATACSSAPDAALDDTRGANETAAAIQVLADTADAESLPTPGRPILLGLEEPAQVDAAPESLAFAEQNELDTAPREQQEPATPSGEPDAAPAPVDTSTTESAEVTPTEVVETDSDPDEADDLGAIEDSDDAIPEVLPLPPPAAPGTTAAYDDPSPVIVQASGRPFGVLGPATTTRGVTDDTITVGGLASETLVGEPFRDTVCLGARARFEQANHYDEVSRRIEFTGCYDDAAQPEFSDGLTRSLIDDGDFAIVPLASPAFFADAVLNEERMPAIGDERLPAFCGRTNPLGFGVRGAQGCPVLDARGYLTLADPVLSAWDAADLQQRPWVDVTYVVAEGPSGETTAASRRFEADLLEVPVPTFLGALPAPGDAARSDWTSTVDAILATGPATVFLEHDHIEGLPEALRTRGYDGHLVLVGSVDPLDVADDEWRSVNAPLTVISLGDDLASTGSRGWRSIVGAAAAVGVDESAVGRDFVDGYLAADFLVQALRATPEPLSVETMADTINGGWWYPGVEGVSCGSWWPASHFIVTPCVSVASIDVFSAELVPVLGLIETTPQLAFNLSE